MKFAVVEYQSKSGNVWRHTSSKPNYLADPKNEIDPTSFGCYVSALNGEHIPITGMILGPIEQVSQFSRFYRKAVKRITGTWPSKYSIEYLLQFDAILIVHQLSDAHEIVNLMKRLRKFNNRPRIVGVPTQPFGLLVPQVEADSAIKKNLVEFIQNCDTFVSVVKDTVDWYSSLSNREITYLPQPYPVDFAKKSYRPLSSKQSKILIAGVTQRNNIKQGHIVARELKKKFPHLSIVIPKVDEYSYDFSELEKGNYQILPFEPWQQHLNTLSSVKLVINTDYTKTRGRVQVDCAAVGTPSIGANSDGQIDLFPDLPASETTNTKEYVEQCTRLMNDDNYYNSISKKAFDLLDRYNYSSSATRLQNLIKTL